MIYLVELDALDGANQPETLRYSDHGLTTLPTDDPPNAAYDPYVRDPGNIERHLFSDGRTFGDVTVGVGVTRLINTDGSLDHLRDYAFDGRAIRIYGLADTMTAFASRQLLLEGTVAQTEFQDGDFTVTVRDWLEALRQPLQTATYAGTTTAGGSAVAEGGEDLKDKTRAVLFGTARGIPLVLIDAFDAIYEISGDGVSAAQGIYDRNVPLAGQGDHATLADLKAAALQPGQYATCNVEGLVRLGGAPFGLITADASEGATAEDRTAGQIVRRMLLSADMVDGVDFYSADCAALDEAAPYECGVWYGPDANVTIIQAVSFVLGSVRGSISPDFSGAYRIRQFVAPVTAEATSTIDEADLPGLEDLDLDVSTDQSDGLPTKKVTIRYGQNLAVANASDIDVNTTPERKAFATQEWRQVARTNEATATRHQLAHEMTRDTAICQLADAETEATAVLALYSAPRIVLREKLPTSEIGEIDLSDIVLFKASRFGLDDGRAFVVIGRTDEFEPGHTTLTLWG